MELGQPAALGGDTLTGDRPVLQHPWEHPHSLFNMVWYRPALKLCFQSSKMQTLEQTVIRERRILRVCTVTDTASPQSSPLELKTQTPQ